MKVCSLSVSKRTRTEFRTWVSRAFGRLAVPQATAILLWSYLTVELRCPRENRGLAQSHMKKKEEQKIPSTPWDRATHKVGAGVGSTCHLHPKLVASGCCVSILVRLRCWGTMHHTSVESCYLFTLFNPLALYASRWICFYCQESEHIWPYASIRSGVHRWEKTVIPTFWDCLSSFNVIISSYSYFLKKA